MLRQASPLLLSFPCLSHQEERIIHVPMWVKNKYNIVSRSIPKLRETLGREPTCEEIAAQVAVDTDSKVRLWKGDIGRASD